MSARRLSKKKLDAQRHTRARAHMHRYACTHSTKPQTKAARPAAGGVDFPSGGTLSDQHRRPHLASRQNNEAVVWAFYLVVTHN